ncbi:MAG: hypothetical protein AAGA48_37005 [Myxococcota bacterium]
MNCDWVQNALLRYDPSTELPDAIVEHIDACPKCRAVLDARFPPATTPHRVEPKPADPVRPWALGVLVAAATIVLWLPLWRDIPPDRRVAMLDASQVCVVVYEPPECETP